MANGKPNLPHHPSNPAGQVDRVRKATAAVSKRLRAVRRWLLDTLDGLEVEQIEANSLAMRVNARYEYQISTRELDRIVNEMRRRLGNLDADQMAEYVRAAYEDGTAQASANLSGLTDDYTREITSILKSRPYQRRLALLQSRVFEEMEGFAGEVGRDLGRTLRQGMEDGQNPLDVARTLRERFSVSRNRAERIARTEIPGAMRRGRWDEDDDAEQRLGVRTKEMHMSALSPTTREDHEARHGNLYTREQVREWYARDGNGINCKCSQVAVLVDADGNPRTPDVVSRVRGMRNT